jgi:hypothetical protein
MSAARVSSGSHRGVPRAVVRGAAGYYKNLILGAIHRGGLHALARVREYPRDGA